MRCRIDRPQIVAAAMVLFAGGCAFDEGEPWGRAEVGLALEWSPAPGRLTSEGYLKTAADYAIDLDMLAVGVDAMTLVLGAAGDAVPGGFDPADPPEGYGLCHGGHCHADDGRLVSYEEIAASMGAGAEGGSRLDVAVADPGTFDLRQGRSEVVFQACPDDCRLPEATLVRAEVALTGLEVRGRVFDRRTGEARRPPEAGVPFMVRIREAVVLKAAVSGAVGPGKPVGLHVEAALWVAERLFDGVDFAAGSLADGEGTLDLSTVPDATRSIREARGDHSILTAEVL